jgi:thiamine pyrophosphate-dependent acetolactate synthase large subunit-like protein
MNLVMGVATAYKDSSPVVAITGQETSVETLAGRFSWQGLGEEDHSGMV